MIIPGLTCSDTLNAVIFCLRLLLNSIKKKIIEFKTKSLSLILRIFDHKILPLSVLQKHLSYNYFVSLMIIKPSPYGEVH